MARYLIVANQTLGGERLDRAVRDRIERGASEFFVVVPMTALGDVTTVAGLGFSMGGEMVTYPTREVVEQDAERRRAMLDDARLVAEGRLSKMLDLVDAAGGVADGEVGDADPVLAVKNVLKDRSFDEIILSTLPARLSRWLRMDLPSRVARMTDLPVTTIEAQDPEPDGTSRHA